MTVSDVTTFWVGLVCLSATSAVTFGEHQDRPDSAPKPGLGSESSRLPDSSLPRNRDQYSTPEGVVVDRLASPEQRLSEESALTISGETHGVVKSNKASCL